MPIDNVVPIDAEAARLLARRDRRFRWFVAGLGAAWLAVLIAIVALTPLPPLVPLLVLGALVVFAEHRFVLFGDETSMSASIVVIVASVFVFADSSPLAGPMLVGSLGGLYLPHLRQRHFGLVTFNGSAMGLAGIGAAATTELISAVSTDPVVPTAAAAVCVAVYWSINNLLVATYQTTATGAPPVRTAILLLTTDAEILLWASIGALCAAASSENVIVQLAWVTAIAVTRVAFDTSLRPISSTPRNSLKFASVPLLIWAVAVALLHEAPDPGPAVFSTAVVVTLLFAPNSPRTTTTPLTALPSIAALLILTSPFQHGVIIFTAVAIAGPLIRQRNDAVRSTQLLVWVSASALLVNALTRVSTPLAELVVAGAAVSITALVPALGGALVLARRLTSASPALLFGSLIPTRTECFALCTSVAMGFALEYSPAISSIAVAIGLTLYSLGTATSRETSASASR